ncbi:MAG: AMP-binding protein, partial [Alphaproteobacteria bacterium]|nr:AMP-binding protein [Alphaproteobacteria bacterium]
MTYAADTSPLWSPSPATVAASRLEAFRKHAETAAGHTLPDYAALWNWSIRAPAAFWELAWDFMGVIGDKGPRVLDATPEMIGSRFFPDGKINYAENLLRRRDDADAIVYRAEDKAERRLSHRALYDRVSQLRQVLLDLGVGPGDRVAGFVSHMPEAVIGLLAASSIGAIWSSASPDFGVQGV